MEILTSFLAENKSIVTIFHVFSVVLGMGCALITDVLFIYFAMNKKLSSQETKIIKILSSIVMYALCIIIITGGVLFLSVIDKYLNSVKFLTKMSIVGILTLNGLLLHKFVFSQLRNIGFLITKKFAQTRRIAFALGSASFISWVSAMSLGVLGAISVTCVTAMSIYALIAILGVAASQALFGLYEKGYKL
jgi:hypothetical protein